jgi:hypothetical protein
MQQNIHFLARMQQNIHFLARMQQNSGAMAQTAGSSSLVDLGVPAQSCSVAHHNWLLLLRQRPKLLQHLAQAPQGACLLRTEIL